MSFLRALHVAVATMTVCGCGQRSPPGPTYTPLGGAVAVAGNAPIGRALVASVARAQGVQPDAALASLVEDALIAQGARDEGLDRSASVTWARTAALGRGVVQQLFERARDEGPPTDDELADLEVVHAVVLSGSSTPEPRAAFVAHAIADAVATARSAEEFVARATAISKEVRTTIEAVPAFDASGQTEDGQPLDPDFVAAAFTLHRPGETSPVVETPSGLQVIRLVSRHPPASALEARRAYYATAVVRLRARSRLASMLRLRREHVRVEVSSAAPDLLAHLATSP